MDQPKVRKITASFVLSWLFGVGMLFMSLGVFMVGSYIAGIIVALCSLLVIPAIDKVLADKFHIQISGGIKLGLAFIAIAAYSTGFTSGALRMSSANGSNESGQIAVNTTTCPAVTTGADKYEIAYGESDSGYRNLYLRAGFITDLTFTDGYELANKPTIGNPYLYTSESFICERGSNSGESTNKLYCRPTYMYEPVLEKKNIDVDGNVVSVDREEVKNFVFDVTGKDLERASDLASLTLEQMTCK